MDLGNRVILRDTYPSSIKHYKKQKIAYKSKYEELKVYTPVSLLHIYTSWLILNIIYIKKQNFELHKMFSCKQMRQAID